MASKYNDIAGFCAFVAVILAGIIGIATAIMHWLGMELPFASILIMVKNILLVIAVFFGGWRFIATSRFKNKIVWEILFIIFAVLALVGIVAL